MKRLFLIPLFLIVFQGFSQTKPQFLTDYDSHWVDSVFNTLDLDDKIGQVLMPRGNYSGQGYNPEKLKDWVRNYKLGGIVFFAGQPTIQAQITNELQALSKVPMMIGVDMEWGLAMRLDSTVRFPFQMTLGAMQGGEEYLYEMGVEVAKQAKRMGIHVNYAPVVDINNNPKNPVINFRSFGEDKVNVATKALAYMQGMQSENLLVTAKHFPGHGDTGVDSHYDLPLISHDKDYLRNNELFPFRYLVDNGLSGVMTAHLNVPAFEPKGNLASTFSSNILSGLLRKEMGFQGLTFTDAMDMQGAVKNYKPGEAHVQAFLAGNDILETFEDVPTAFNALKQAVLSGKISRKFLDERVKRILKAKSWVGLDQYKPIEIKGMIEDINTLHSDFLNRVFAEKSLVALADKNIPIKDLSKHTTIVSIGVSGKTYFENMAENYTGIDFYRMEEKGINLNMSSKFDQEDNLIVALHLGNNRPGVNYGFEDYMQQSLNLFKDYENAVLVIFGNPYVLDKIEGIDSFSSIILANQDSKYMEEAAAMAVFGGIETNGRLSVTVNGSFKAGDGIFVPQFGRLAYGTPEMVGLDSRVLEARLDSVALLGLNEKAYPGATMEVALKGRVIYKKAFGYHTYEDGINGDWKAGSNLSFNKTNQGEAMDSRSFVSNYQNLVPKIEKPKGAVDIKDLYDLASVTKISTSTLAVMQLMSEEKFDPDKSFADYYAPFKGSNKADLKFRDMLTHRSGLKAWIPFWMNCIDSVSTLKNAVAINPELESLMIYEKEKQSFWDRIKKKEPTYAINYAKSLAEVPGIWQKALSVQSLTWHPGIFSDKKTKRYSVEITDSLFMDAKRMKYIFKQIEASPVNPGQGYVYSDLHFYTYPIFIEKLTGQNWEEYLKETYSALGAHSLTYNPRRFYSLDQIVPTERDTLFRKTLIHGRVHDEGAGMLNGVSGHAGLFGNVNDLTKLMQMYLQNGYYGGRQFIKPKIVEEATSYQFPYEGSRRAIGFDKLDFNKNIRNGPQLASPRSYGHSGFTGTFTWIDPEYEMVYVFLSNRVYPTRDNNKISQLDIRTTIGDQIIKTIKEQ